MSTAISASGGTSVELYADKSDQFVARASQLRCLLCTMYGAAGLPAFMDLNEQLQASMMWLVQDLASEMHDLSDAFVLRAKLDATHPLTIRLQERTDQLRAAAAMYSGGGFCALAGASEKVLGPVLWLLGDLAEEIDKLAGAIVGLGFQRVPA